MVENLICFVIFVLVKILLAIYNFLPLYRLFLIAFIAFFLHCRTYSQVVPAENSILNYRVAGFSWSPVQHSGNYKLEIAAGNWYGEDSFITKIVNAMPSATTRIIAQVPSFGAQYTWRVVNLADGDATENKEFHHFSTLATRETDTSQVRLRIIDSATRFKDAYVFLDGNMVLYDMYGNPVWELPDSLRKMGNTVRDIKLTPQSTITFLLADEAYEIDYNGRVLWKGPNDGKISADKKENYHHEFTRLTNGHYMVLGAEFITLPGSSAGQKNGKDSLNIPGMKMPFGTIIEYDEKGNVAWSWRSSKYFEESDLVNYRPDNNKPAIDLHENAFFFDEKEKVIYLSFRNISRIVKIKYPEGNVINAYGEVYKPGVAGRGNGLFCGQHSCRYSQIGCLFLFNNNGCAKDSPPKIKMLKEAAGEDSHLKKIWEYECSVEENYPRMFSSGGNVVELPDSCLFVCMGGSYSKLFIVNLDKKLIWSALPEQWNAEKKKWEAYNQYRASIIYNRKDIESMVWNAGAAR